MAKKFDMAALAKEALGDVNVSKVDTVRMIPVELIDPNPKNFYEMSDLEELAGSIEAWGLVHPIKVSPVDGRYVITDGERRFRATKEILGRTEIQCIVSAQVNTLLEEMQLIEANRTQRKMSAADLSRQAERYTELLAQLKEAGVAIPGRLRDRVAEALQVSASKLARLHAIRENLEPGLLSLFDDGDLNESTAYELSKFDHMKQDRIWDALADANLEFSVENVQRAARRDDAARTIDEPKTLPTSDAGTSWDAEAYLQVREEEDLKYFDLLRHVADRFMPLLTAGESRQDGIADLKETYRYRGFSDSACYADGSGRGLTLTCPGFKVLRTWTEVYDMLCIIALRRAAEALRSNSDTPPAGIEWHHTAPDCMPPDCAPYGSAILLWGDGGLSRTPDTLVKMTINAMPETARWWAVVKGPEEEE